MATRPRPGHGTDELRRFIRSFEDGFPADLRTELRRPLRQAGERARTLARSNAAWSTRIPGAIRLRVSFTARRPGVILEVDQRRAPHGRALEHLGKAGWFRHPVFGQRRRWVRQRSRPYLFPAARAAMAAMDTDIAAAVDMAAAKHGFR
ncbi:HK97 gp10 family phage protein [Nonomuraea sp. NPDC050328]|uniref:HK97 gp10 family phage protein n=1 Tax=Nonomuraea sp. NPDC050328 TaxID=3364361 RepID=UPI00379E8307